VIKGVTGRNFNELITAMGELSEDGFHAVSVHRVGKGSVPWYAVMERMDEEVEEPTTIVDSAAKRAGEATDVRRQPVRF